MISSSGSLEIYFGISTMRSVCLGGIAASSSISTMSTRKSSQCVNDWSSWISCYNWCSMISYWSSMISYCSRCMISYWSRCMISFYYRSCDIATMSR